MTYHIYIYIYICIYMYHIYIYIYIYAQPVTYLVARRLQSGARAPNTAYDS